MGGAHALGAPPVPTPMVHWEGRLRAFLGGRLDRDLFVLFAANSQVLARRIQMHAVCM